MDKILGDTKPKASFREKKKKRKVEHFDTGIIFSSEYYAAKALKVDGRNLRKQLTGEKRNMLGIRYI